MAAAGVGFSPHLPLLFFKEENTGKSYLTYRRFSVFKNVNLTAIKTGFPAKNCSRSQKKPCTPTITPKQSSPKFKIMRKKSIPCYIANGGVHDVVNVPLGQFTRWRLKLLVRELLRTQQTLETFVAAKATPKTIQLLEALAKILDLNLKPKQNRAAAITLQSAVEKNLKPKSANQGTDETINLVQFSVKCGLIVVCFLVGAFMQQCEGIIY